MPGRPTVQILLHVFLRVGAVTCLVCNFQGLNFKLDIQTILCTTYQKWILTFFHMSYLNYPGSRQKLGTIFETKGLQNLSMRIWKKPPSKAGHFSKVEKKFSTALKAQFAQQMQNYKNLLTFYSTWDI